MRFCLRTLMILLAVGPPALAGLWFSAPILADFWAASAFLSVVLLLGFPF